ncbi:hypothetical protein N7512_000910 [Penicillium capsulatum]|nr:hypothetical protein N7512_000910 [Penicillium capsulatum]
MRTESALIVKGNPDGVPRAPMWADKYKGCECQEDDIEKAEVNVHPVSPSWLDTQQKFLGKAKDLPEDKPEEKPKCVTTSNTGIVDDDFIKARDEFCKDPSKKYDKDHFELAFKKSSGDCPKDDCKNTLNSIWNTCADYHSRPEPSSDDKLSEHHGPLRGTAEATGKCGKYTAKKTDVKPKFKPPGEDAPAPNGKPFEVSCHKEPGAIGVKKDDMEAAIDEFCKNGRSLDPSKDSRAGSLFKKLDGGTLILHGSPNMGHNPEPIDWYKDKNACQYVPSSP